MVSQFPADFCPERATCKTFYNCLLVIFNGLSKFARNFTARSLKIIYTHPIHIVHWRNFPIKNCQCNDYKITYWIDSSIFKKI